MRGNSGPFPVVFPLRRRGFLPGVMQGKNGPWKIDFLGVADRGCTDNSGRRFRLFEGKML